MTPEQGDVWWAEAEDKRRPVLVVTRSEAVPVLSTILVAPITRTIRDIPTEVPLGADEGLPDECVASCDDLQPIRRAFLTERAGRLGPDGRLRLCGALQAVADC